MAQIAKDAAGIVTKITGTISHLITDEESGDTDTVQQIRSPLSLSLNFVSRLAAAGGKMGTRFCQELSGNPILLHNLQRVLDLAEYKQELWVPAMGVLKWLALHDEATAKENGSTHAVIPKLKAVFLNTGDDGRSLRQAAGEVLANLTITTSDNCRTILEGPGRHDLIKNLIGMLQDDDNNYVSVAANLLHNLYVNSGDMLIDLDLDLDAKEGLKSALRMVSLSVICFIFVYKIRAMTNRNFLCLFYLIYAHILRQCKSSCDRCQLPIDRYNFSLKLTNCLLCIAHVCYIYILFFFIFLY